MAAHAYCAVDGKLPPQPIILIAEDEPINQILMRAVLMKSGCHTKVAANGADAVDLVAAARKRGRPYSLVLMDLQMPSMDGFEATRRIRDLGIGEDELPIVAFTARWSSGCVRDCRRVGMQDAVAKPLEAIALRRLVDQWCRNRGIAEPANSDDHVAKPIPGHSRNKRHLASLLSRSASSSPDGPTAEEVRTALIQVAGSAHRSGEHDFAATAAGFVPVFEIAASCDDLSRLARHCIAQLEPLGMRIPACDGGAGWLESF